MLLIRHVEERKSEESRFQLEFEGEATQPIGVPSAMGYPIEGRPRSDLMSELRWYLEDFAEYPLPPEFGRSQRTLQSLERWIQEVEEALFGPEECRFLLNKARRRSTDSLRLQLRSDDPKVLSWPWEMLIERHAEPGWSFERCLDGSTASRTGPDQLPTDQINVLLVTCRPLERDANFRLISRPLVELIDQENVSMSVHLLRPPTLGRLKRHLEERPDHYHILHFDGHGDFSDQGELVFEDDDGKAQLVGASVFARLLRRHGIPIVVLNACQSAMLKPHAGHEQAGGHAFASVATAILKAGAHSVVAMAYALHTRAAEIFLQGFYRRLLLSGDILAAMESGRQKMRVDNERTSPYGPFPLVDWMIPVFYRHVEAPLFLGLEGLPKAASRPVAEPGEEPPVFVGRDGAILRLERALRRDAPGILVCGLMGVGKTALVRHVVRWLAQTDGVEGICWLAFQEVRSAEFVFASIAETLDLDLDRARLPIERKIERLSEALRYRRWVVVWDHYEAAAETPGLGAPLPLEDRELLKDFLVLLRGGLTKVLITSRSPVEDLAPHVETLRLFGLQVDERWLLCEIILKNLGLWSSREAPELRELLDVLAGHPLSMQWVFGRLAERSAGEILKSLRSASQDEGIGLLFAIFEGTLDAVAGPRRPLLIALALHERFIDEDSLRRIAERAELPELGAESSAFLKSLERAGWIQAMGSAVFEMHPALSSFLRGAWVRTEDEEQQDRWARSFVEVFARLADALVQRPLPEQPSIIYLHSSNFLAAAEIAERLELLKNASALRQALGFFALQQKLYSEATAHFEKLLALRKERGFLLGEASTLHELGMVAFECRDYGASETRFLESLEVNRRIDNDEGAAINCHQLGRVAEERRELEAAATWYHRAVELNEKVGCEARIVGAFHQLGSLSFKQGELDSAERWYRKSLEIGERLRIHQEVGNTCGQLGALSRERGDLSSARRWVLKSLEIYKKTTHMASVAKALHELGLIDQDSGDLASARKWFQRSLGIEDHIRHESGSQTSYFQLGRVAELNGDFSTARAWYEKSLSFSKGMGPEYAAGLTFLQMAGVQDRLEGAARLLAQAFLVFFQLEDVPRAQSAISRFKGLYLAANETEKVELRRIWEETGLPWPDNADSDT